MFQSKNKFIGVLATAMVLFFFQTAHADLGNAIKVKRALTLQSVIGTDSAGSYAYGEKKSEGSKTKSYSHKKSEGSKSKSYSGHHGAKSGHGHAYSAKHRKHHPGHHKSEGSHKKHAYKGGHSKHHYAKSHSGHEGHKAHSSKCFFSHLLNFRHQLQLTADQVEQIQHMRFEYGKNRVMLKAEKEVAKMEFDRLVHGKEVDESAIRAAGEKIIAAKTKKIRAKVEAKIALMKLLTDEQRAKVHKMHDSH